MASRQTQFAESTGLSTTTAGSYQDKTTLTFTPDASSTYYFFWTALINNSATTGDTLARLYNSTSATVLGGFNIESNDASDFACVGGLAKEAIGGSPASTTWKIQYYDESATAGIKEARILALKATGNEHYVESLGNSTTTSATPQDKVTSTETYAAGDYVILASAALKSNGVTVYKCMLDVDGTDYGTLDSTVSDVSGTFPWMIVKHVTFTAASHTVKIQFSANGTDTTTISDARILIMPVSDFNGTNYAEDTTLRTRTGVGSNAYGDGATLTFTPPNKEHIVFCSAVFGENSAANSAQVQFLEGATNKGESIKEPQSATPVLQSPYWNFYRATLAASSTTWKLQYLTESTSSTVSIDEQAILVLQTEESAVTLTIQDAAHGHSADGVTFAQVHALAIQDAAHAQAADNATFAQVHALAIANADHAQAADNVTLATQHILGIQNADHALTSDTATFTQEHIFVIADCAHALTSDTATFSQVHSLTIADASHAHIADNVTFDIPLLIDNAAHAHAADGVTFAQVHTFSINDALHGHTGDSVTFDIPLIIADASHAHAADGVTFAQNHVYVIADALHGHTADEVDLDETAEEATLAPDDAVHAVTSDAATFSQNHVVVVQDAAHAHGADGVTFTQMHTLLVDDSLHVLTSEDVTFTQAHVLGINDALHAQTADGVTFQQIHLLLISDAAHAHTGESPTLSTQHILAIDGALHLMASEDATFTQAHLLTIDDCLHAHVAENTAFAQQHVIEVLGAIHLHSADEVTIVATGAFIIDGDRVLYVPLSGRTASGTLDSRTVAAEINERLRNSGANDRILVTSAKDRTT